MSIASIIAAAEADAALWAGKAETFLAGVAISVEQKAVALVKETSIGTAIINMISAMNNTSLTGAERMAAVVSGAEAGYKAFVAAGGLTGLLLEGVSILRQLAQLIYDEFVAAFLSVKPVAA